MAVQKNFCDQSSRPSVHHKSSTNQRPLNSISTAQPYDSEAKPRRNSSKKGNAEIGQRHVPASRDKTKSEKRKREKRGVQEEEEEKEGRDRMINRFSQYLSRDHENFSNIVPSIPSDNGISILPADKRSISPFGPIDPASSNEQPLPFCSPKRICSFGRMEPRVRVGKLNSYFRAFSIGN